MLRLMEIAEPQSLIFQRPWSYPQEPSHTASGQAIQFSESIALSKQQQQQQNISTFSHKGMNEARAYKTPLGTSLVT